MNLGIVIPGVITVLVILGLWMRMDSQAIGHRPSRFVAIMIGLGVAACVCYYAASVGKVWPIVSGLILTLVFLLAFGRTLVDGVDAYLIRLGHRRTDAHAPLTPERGRAASSAEELETRTANIRQNILIVSLYTLFLLLVPQISGQALDALRSWSFRDLGNDATKTLLGIASTCLFGLALREIMQTKIMNRDSAPPFRTKRWAVIGATVAGVGALVAWFTPANWGVAVLGGLVLLLSGLGAFSGSRRR